MVAANCGTFTVPKGAVRRAGVLMRILDWCVPLERGERRVVWLAFACNFALLADYYLLRPVRDTLATEFAGPQLNLLFVGTFVAMVLCAPVYGWLTAHFRLTKLLPGLFWFWLANIAIFAWWLRLAPASRWAAGTYFVWFSVTNLYLISVFWSLMVDLFTAAQATRLFAFIAAGGSIGAIIGPLFTRTQVLSVGLDGVLWRAAGGFVVVIVLVHALVREKGRASTAARQGAAAAQTSTLDHALHGNALSGFRQVLGSRYMQQQALFMLFMTWIATFGYFLQTDLLARSIGSLTGRAVVIADLDLVVNAATAAVLVLGVARFMRRFGVTAALLLNPLLMIAAFLAVAVSPTLRMVQLLQAIRRVAQYAIARPSREICFTVLDQDRRYQAKNVIDTAVYRLGDVTAALLQGGMRMAGFGLLATVGLGVVVAALWGASALALGRQFERLRAYQRGAA